MGKRGSQQPIGRPLFHVSGHWSGDVLVVEVEGELDLATAPRLVEHLEAWIGSHDRSGYQVWIGMSNVGFLDVSGYRGLEECEALVDASDGSLKITQPSPQVRRLLGLVGREDMIEEQRDSGSA